MKRPLREAVVNGGDDGGIVVDAEIEQLERDFLAHLWLPFTQMQGLAPVIMASADGAVVRDVHGKEYIDAFASLWTVNVGHGRQEIYDAIMAQAKDVACFHMFGIANVPSIKLAAKVAECLPGDLDHAFLCLGGGEAVETALKIARQYWRNKGQGSKYMVFYRDRAYHGTSFGVASAQGLALNRQKFEPLPPGVHQARRALLLSLRLGQDLRRLRHRMCPGCGAGDRLLRRRERGHAAG